MPDRSEAISAAELAERSRVDVDRIEMLVAAGVIHPRSGAERPFSPADVMRVEVATSTEQGGVTLEDLSAAIARGELSLGYLDALPPPPALRSETAGELAGSYAIPFDTLQHAMASFGLPVPAAGDRVRTDDGEIYAMLATYLEAGLEGAALYDACRIFGDAIRRLGQYQVDLFHTRFEQPYRDQGLPENELLDRAIADVASVTSGMGPVLVSWLYRRHSEAFAIQHRVEHAEAALEQAGVRRRRPADPPAIVFLDLTGYTAITERRGDEVSAEIALSLAAVVDEPVRLRGGHVVKWLGDGVELYFVEPAEAVACSLDLAARMVPSGLPPAHVGINVGAVVYRGGDYYGRTVNIASRIAGVARPGQVLTGPTVPERCEGRGLRFEPAGSFTLKGVDAEVELFAASFVGDGGGEEA